MCVCGGGRGRGQAYLKPRCLSIAVIVILSAPIVLYNWWLNVIADDWSVHSLAGIFM